MSWNQLSPRGLQQSYCIRFTGTEAFERFKEAFAQCQYEMLHGISWDKVKVSTFYGDTSFTSYNI